LAAFVVYRDPGLRNDVQVLLRLEPPPQITPLTLVTPPPSRPPPSATTPPIVPPASATSVATAVAATTASPSLTPAPLTATASPIPPTATPAPVVINGRTYDAYIPAAVKNSQLYQYTCEFDAAWVVLQSFGIDVGVDEIIARTSLDNSIEPYFEETAEGFFIYGGDIRSAFSGNYQENFLARSTGRAIAPVFASFGLEANPISDRAGVENALRSGQLVWMKTTVDFKPWRPAIWVTPSGERIPTVLGNDHAVVAIGFNSEVVVIRDVLGPTSSNRQRPLEYEVSWETFLAAWGAQNFDALAVAPPRKGTNTDVSGFVPFGCFVAKSAPQCDSLRRLA
jgi:uncharacterized protein YvpB